jgi:hypothetical protein
VDCALVWLDGEPVPRALALEGRVLVLGTDHWIQRAPLGLEPDDQIVLPTGFGELDAGRLLSRELMAAIDERNHALVLKAREWRRCLDELVHREHLDVGALSTRLADVGVVRGEQTVEAWLSDSGSEVIQPNDAEVTLRSLWDLIGPLARYPLEEILEAGRTLRRLHQRAGHATWAAWKGTHLTLPVDDAWLGDWARKARARAQRHVVDQVARGSVPVDLVGWPVPGDFEFSVGLIDD